MSWRSQCFPLPSMCLTNPLWGTCPSLPFPPLKALGSLGCSGMFLQLHSPLLLSPFLPDCLPVVKGRPWLPFLCFRVLISFTRSDFTCQTHGTPICAVAFRGERQTPPVCFPPCLQEPVTVSSHVVTISSLTPATSYNCSVTTFSHNSPSIPTFIAVSTMGEQPFPAFFFFLIYLQLFSLAF